MRLITKQDRLNSQNVQFNSLKERGFNQEVYKGLNIFTKQENGKFYLNVYKDTSSNSLANYYYQSEERMLKAIQGYKDNYDRNLAYKAKVKENPTHSTAANIREELKKEFPGMKFSVTSDTYSMGNSVRISWTDGPTSDQVEAITDKYQQGHFNGMEDIYEYSNSREDIPQAKYVQQTRSKSDEVQKAIFEEVQKAWGDQLSDYELNRRVYEQFAKTSYYTKQETKEVEKPNLEKVEVVAGEVQIIEYSTKAIAVIGDTKPIKDKLKALGGKFNFHLTCGAGWIFPKTRLNEVQTSLTA
jgi:nitrogen regulatory protein PII-like uncharacterized protein